MQFALPIYLLFGPTNKSTDGWVVGEDNAAVLGEFYTIAFPGFFMCKGGQYRYYSNIVIDGQKADCMWIDKNKYQPVTGFQVHFPEFVQSTKDDPPIHDAA